MAMISMKRIARQGWPLLAVGLLLGAGILLAPLVRGSPAPHVQGSFSPPSVPPVTVTRVPGQTYRTCSKKPHYLKGPWTYQELTAGHRSYTVSQYKALKGYGTTLPPLPSYIASESATTKAAVIYAPGSSVSQPAYA